MHAHTSWWLWSFVEWSSWIAWILSKLCISNWTICFTNWSQLYCINQVRVICIFGEHLVQIWQEERFGSVWHFEWEMILTRSKEKTILSEIRSSLDISLAWNLLTSLLGQIGSREEYNGSTQSRGDPKIHCNSMASFLDYQRRWIVPIFFNRVWTANQ